MVLSVFLIQPKNIYTRRAKLYKDRYLELQNIQYRLKVFFVLFLKEVSLFSSIMHLFDQKHSKNSNIVKYYYNLK